MQLVRAYFHPFICTLWEAVGGRGGRNLQDVTKHRTPIAVFSLDEHDIKKTWQNTLVSACLSAFGLYCESYLSHDIMHECMQLLCGGADVWAFSAAKNVSDKTEHGLYRTATIRSRVSFFSRTKGGKAAQ